MEKIIYKKTFTLFFFLFLFTEFIFPQVNQTDFSLPFLKYFSSKEYKAHGQNFDALQDDRGILYFANFSGVLEYDGANWRVIPTTNNAQVTSIAKDKNGRIYVGARGEFGYLTVTKMGKMIFFSISAGLKEEDKNFKEIISTLVTEKGVYFISEKTIFFWDKKNIKVIKVSSQLLSAFYANNNLYCYEKDKGLKLLQGESLLAVNGMESILPSIEFYSMIPLSDGRIILGSGNQGLYILTDGKATKFSTDADAYLIKNKLTCGILLNDGNIALGTNRGGIVILQLDGRVKQIIDQNKGLINENVKALFIDRNNSLWAALNNGIALIDVQSPLSYINESIGPKGGVTSIIRDGNKLYFGSYRGLSYLQDNSSTFKTISSINTACWSLLQLGNSVLAATSEGIFEIKNDASKQITKSFSLYLYRSKSDPSLIYSAQTDGITILKLSGSNITPLKTIPNLNYEVRRIAEDSYGNIWICTPFKGIFRYSFHDNKIKHFDASKGLPSLIGNQINIIDGKLLITSQYGIFTFNQAKDVFVKDPLSAFLSGENKNEWINNIYEDERGNIITNNGEEINLTFYKKINSGKYLKNSSLLSPVSDFITWTVFSDKNNKIWFGGPDGLVILNLNIPLAIDNNFSSFLRKAVTGADKEIFGGSFYTENGIQSLIQNSLLKPDINYFDNTISFEFGAACFDVKNAAEYQYILEGFDKGWSDWSRANTKEYTNLSEGKYLFKIRAKNIYGIVSKEAVYEFRIRVPWFRAWYAYLLYIAILTGAVLGFVKIRSRKLEKEKQILENLIEERTTEVVKQKEEIEEKSNELSDKNDELEKINQIVKSINSEIHFSNLLQSILNQILVIKGIEKAAILVFDKETNLFKFKASYNWDNQILNSVQLTLEAAESIYLKNMNEIFEDIFYSDNFRMIDFSGSEFKFEKSASMLVLLVKVDDKADGFLILENIRRKEAFSNKDIQFLKNLKEHIITAFIKTKILEDLQVTLDNLQDTQAKLVQSEKLASLGQLTAGIAHEIKNPLNFINNFSDLSKNLITELDEEINPFKEKFDSKALEIIDEILGDLKHNLLKINEHGKRVDSIVKGMLLHSRGKSGEMQKSSINSLLNEFISLAYHGFRAQDSTFNIKLVTEFDESIEMINVVPQNLSRVFINILNNACYSTNEKKREKGSAYAPVLTVTTKNLGDKVEIRIKDNGKGIPQTILDKIFNPFFTTKPAGKGTGLGLSLSYDIITQEHKGEIKIESEEGEYAEFIICIPKTLTQTKV